jgi:hypothetical protein
MSVGSVSGSSAKQSYQMQWQWQLQPTTTPGGSGQPPSGHYTHHQAGESLQAQGGGSNDDSDYEYDEQNPSEIWVLVLQQAMFSPAAS